MMLEFTLLWFGTGLLSSFQYVKVNAIENRKKLNSKDIKNILLLSLGGFITVFLLLVFTIAKLLKRKFK